MNKSAITKTLKKCEEFNTEYSLGFSRLMSLPSRVRKFMGVAAILEGVCVNKIHEKQKYFLDSLTEEEFKNWMRIQ